MRLCFVTLLLVTLPLFGQSITEYPLAPLSSPEGITAGPDGAVWFTEVLAGRIGRITLAGEITEFTLPAGAQPREIVVGPDGLLWYADSGRNAIGRMNLSGSVTEFPIPSGTTLHITPGLGALWFDAWLLPNDGYIGRVDPSTGVITEFPLPSIVPSGIAAGPDGNLWFTNFYGNAIVRMTPAGAMTSFPIPTPDSRPIAVTAGPDGNLWFLEARGNKIGRITTSGAITEFAQANELGLSDIAAGPDGALWFTNWPNSIGRITVEGHIQTVRIPTANGGAIGITAGPDGTIWFTENAESRIGRLNAESFHAGVPALSTVGIAALIALLGFVAVRRA